jgi:hypothetical protein
MTKPSTENKQVLQISGATKEEQAASMAHVMASPSLNAARLQLAFNPNQGLELVACLEEMRKQCADLKKGDTARIEYMLLTQAHSLQAMFTYYANKSASAEYLNHLKIHSTIALKAQNQCRQTLAVLAEMKNPKRAVFIKNQATNQQVNLHSKPEIPEINSSNPSNELISGEAHETVDSRGEEETSATNPQMATVENRRS